MRNHPNASNHPWESIYYREGHVFTAPFPRFREVVEKFKQHQCRSILDLGCGNGRHVVALVKEGFKTTGLDISSSGLHLTGAWLEEENLQANLVQSDARQHLPFETGSFDGILSTQVIHHALLSEVRLTIGEICRVLTDEGIAFVTLAGSRDENMSYEEVEPGTYIPLDGTEKGLPHHIFTEKELRMEFSGFQIQEISWRAEGKVLAIWVMKVE